MKNSKRNICIPELTHLSEAERRQLWRRARFKAFSKWQTWYAFCNCGLLGGLLGWSVQYGTVPIILTGAAVFVSGGLFQVVLVQMAREWIRETVQGNTVERSV